MRGCFMYSVQRIIYFSVMLKKFSGMISVLVTIFFVSNYQLEKKNIENIQKPILGEEDLHFAAFVLDKYVFFLFLYEITGE